MNEAYYSKMGLFCLLFLGNQFITHHFNNYLFKFLLFLIIYSTNPRFLCSKIETKR